jgi:hypothetical protein
MNGITSQVSQGKSDPGATILSNRTKRSYRIRGLNNLLKMGHCAPAVMQTLLDLKDSKEDRWVRMAAGLPGGIGSTGYECGGITAPLIQFGLEYGLCAKHNGLPAVIYASHDYARRFQTCNKSLLCRDILGHKRVPLPCIKVASLAPELYKQTNFKNNEEAFSDETREAFQLIYTHLSDNDFHCAHNVLKVLGEAIPITRELLYGTSGFIGGTAFKGLTCSAFTAGLMAVGLKLGEIEDSYPRVMRMLAIMIAGGNAFAEHLNKFNKVMNIGHRMSKWFTSEFGSTLCREITQCDFSSAENVTRYIEKGSLTTCKIIAEKVARQAERIIQQNGDGFVL